ncbi:MAG: hypothetical protein U5M72_03825 [Pseudomonas sp.]|nr:hypothetical protein [Pseudomonas sp.]
MIILLRGGFGLRARFVQVFAARGGFYIFPLGYFVPARNFYLGIFFLPGIPPLLLNICGIFFFFIGLKNKPFEGRGSWKNLAD